MLDYDNPLRASTWMCVRGVIHANDAGYALMGATVAARLDRPTTPGNRRRALVGMSDKGP